MYPLLILITVATALYDSDNTLVQTLDNDNFERLVKLKKGKWLI
jgi:thioredoxin-like negative regulator of GroEL